MLLIIPNNQESWTEVSGGGASLELSSVEAIPLQVVVSEGDRIASNNDKLSDIKLESERSTLRSSDKAEHNTAEST